MRFLLASMTREHPSSANDKARNDDRAFRKQMYGSQYYEALHEGAQRSAAIIVPLIVELTSPSSVVDVGCGTGVWLAEFMRAGIDDIVGIDGDHIDSDKLKIPRELFIAHDLKRSLSLDRTFDLAMSLEVAEHLPPSKAESLVKFLAGLAPIVVFSAAIPHQSGEGHINERWPDYWARLFAEHRFDAVDCIRPVLFGRSDVQPWYAQNTLLYVQRDRLDADAKLRSAVSFPGELPLRLVHPRIYLETMRNPPPREAMRVVLKSFGRLPIRGAKRLRKALTRG